MTVKVRKPVLGNVKVKVPVGCVWAGPCGAGPQGGVTQSLLSRYLVCKERFRLLVVEGLRPHPRFHPPMDFGTMWHACEEGLAVGEDWNIRLEQSVVAFRNKYPLEIEPILHWYSVCCGLFPLYVEHWSKHDDVRNRTPLLSEQSFDVPLKLPSGRTVRLRGKWDSVDLVGDGVWVQENKTKSSIDRQKIERQLRFDLQTMLYVVALRHWNFEHRRVQPIVGVRFNVVRRSAHKSTESMLKKLGEDRAAGRINEWFDRWNVEVSVRDMDAFLKQCLLPELENLCDDYELWSDCKRNGENAFEASTRRGELYPHHFPRHSRRPFGLYDILAEGGATDLDNYLETGSEAGLQRTNNLFPEL